MVYVIGFDGKPLMPTERHGKVRRMLRDGLAKVVKKTPFTIQLLYETTSYTQDITLGVDAGSKHVGLSASTAKNELYAADVELRNDITTNLATRKQYRKDRRSRNTRYRPPRFDNRVRSKHKGWLAPSVENKIQTHTKVVDDVCKILPVTKIVVDTASFDIQKIKNPEISGKEYQQGPQLDFWNVREYVLFKDDHTCRCCKGKSKDKVLRVGHYVIEVVKKVPVRRYKPDNGRYMSIDIGVDNTCAVITNDGGRPLIINGRGAKSVNQKYNKNIARYKSIWDKCNKTVLNEARKAAGLPCVMSSKRIDAITRNRNNRITDMFHKISRVIADKANRDGVCAIVIGKNTDWKQNSNLGRQNNQNFVHLPFAKLIDMITYKARNYGIRVITVDEKYTSGTSFLDGEDPVKENYNKKRRIHRGLFWTKNALINADVNAACQILKKAYPMAFDETALKRNIRARGRLGSTAGDSGRPVSFTYEAAKALLNPVKCDVDELLTAAGKPALANVISLAC